MMVRDAEQMQVLMILRHQQIKFAGGALVFPGGKAGREDSDPAWQDILDGAPDDPVAASLRIAAVREAYEESGLLLARPAARRGVGAPLLHPDEAPALFASTSGEMPAGAFQATIRGAGLVLALDALAPFANWLTPDAPELSPKRFDTHFFVAVAPPDQVAACDGHEAVDACWISPKQALQDADDGKRLVMFPTRMNLEMLSRSGNAKAAISDTLAREWVRVEPQIFWDGADKKIRIPAEAGYCETTAPFGFP
jgi:8-oxo-dGTP pyrophosphatase MutT (NUDIX family)